MKFGIALTLAGIIFLSFQHSSSATRSTLEVLSAPIIQLSGKFRAYVFAPIVFIESMKHLEQDIETLRAERAMLLSLLEIKNVEELKKKEIRTPTGDNESFLTTLLIASEQPMVPVGARQGVKEGAMVNSRDALVGIVKRVGVQFSQVELLSNLSQKLSVRVREVGAEGLLEQEKGEPILTHVRPDVVLKEGQVVTTFGSSEGILPYVPIAKIKKILSSPADPFHRASLELLIIPKDGDAVSVLKNATDTGDAKKTGDQE